MSEIKNPGKSIRAKLLNVAKQKDVFYQTILTRYFQERLLYRISQTHYRENFYLKGGALMYAYERFAARPTLDIDFLGTHISNDGERIADYNHPVGNADRAGKRQKHTRNHRGQIADGLGPFHNFTVQPFKEHTRCHRHRSDRQRAEPEKVDRSHQRRDHGDDHVQHDILGGLPAVKMRGGRHNELFHIISYLPLFSQYFCPGGWPVPICGRPGRRRRSSRTPCRS